MRTFIICTTIPVALLGVSVCTAVAQGIRTAPVPIPNNTPGMVNPAHPIRLPDGSIAYPMPVPVPPGTPNFRLPPAPVPAPRPLPTPTPLPAPAPKRIMLGVTVEPCQNGVRVLTVIAGTPATMLSVNRGPENPDSYESLVPGDVLVSIGGHPVNSYEDLVAALKLVGNRPYTITGLDGAHGMRAWAGTVYPEGR